MTSSPYTALEIMRNYEKNISRIKFLEDAVAFHKEALEKAEKELERCKITIKNSELFIKQFRKQLKIEALKERIKELEALEALKIKLEKRKHK